MKRIAIFASGSGSNAENIIRHFRDSSRETKIQVLTNNPSAKVLQRCKVLDISAFSFNRVSFTETDDVKDHLLSFGPDLIVLAGFLWKFPKKILNEFPNQVINIHPALLPNYGGKGMYGHFVHEAVINNKESTSGITIHYVNEHYDEGATIFQTKCVVTNEDTPETLANKIHELEMRHFPEVIEDLLYH